MPNNLPPFLEKAQKRALQHHNKDQDDYLTTRWEKFVEKLCQQVPEVAYDQETRLLTLGNISPGCVYCRTGQWDCFFVTDCCNLNCEFCYSQNKTSGKFQGSNLGNEVHHNLSRYQQLGIKGLSFSGGEALLEKEQLYQWLSDATQSGWLSHIWLYTNGLLLNEAVIKELARRGLNEIRFNAAATGYRNPYVLRMLNKSAKYLERVTVEIPLISAHEKVLLKSLKSWAESGVRVLNIHELLFEPGSNAENFPGEKQTVTMPDGHITAVSPQSDDLALKIFQTVQSRDLDLGINYCSTAGKWQQLTARREMLLPLTREDNEYYLGNGLLESYFAVDGLQVRAISRETLENSNTINNHNAIYRLLRMAPLSLYENDKQWLQFEAVT